MMIKIILFVFCYPILPIMYIILKNEIEPKKNIVLGVTLPTDELNNLEVKEIITGYYRLLRKITILLAIIPLSALFVKHTSISYTIFMLWTLAICFVLFLPMVQGNKKLKALKEQQNWILEDMGNTIVDLNISLDQPPKTKSLWFLPAVIISILPVIYDGTRIYHDHTRCFSLIGSITMAFVTLIFYFVYKMASRTKTDIVSKDPLKNETLTRIRRYNWRKYSILLAYTNAVYTIPFWLYINKYFHSMFWFLAITLIYCCVVIYLCLKAEFKIRLAQRQYTLQNTDNLVGDDDCYWPFGIFYYNPHNTHIIVEKRIGMGSTINLAKPIGKFLTVLIIGILLVLPISCFAIIQSEFTPIKLTVDQDGITANHLLTTYDINFDDIQTIEIWTELPDTSKDNGTSFDNLAKGKFSVYQIGSCTLCLNPNNHYFLFITKHNGKKYIFSAKTDKDTQVIYEKIKNLRRQF